MPNLLIGTRAEAESDSSTSSSENESLISSASSTRSAHRHDIPAALPTSIQGITGSSKTGSNSSESSSSSDSSDGSDIEAQLAIPRKILRLRKTIYDALHCALCIIAHHKERRGVDEAKSGGKRRAGNLSKRVSPKGKGKGRATNVDIEPMDRSTYSMGSEIIVDPWTKLGGWTRSLRIALDSMTDSQQLTLVKPSQSLQANLNILAVLLNRVTILARDKSYIRTLTGSEARAARSIASSHYSYRSDKELGINNARGRGREQKDDIESEYEYEGVIEDTPPLIMLRLARYSLGIPTTTRTTPVPHRYTPRPRPRSRSRRSHLSRRKLQDRYLDLSDLPFSGPVEILEDLALQLLFDLFGIDNSTIKHLDLSGNNLPRMPHWSTSSSSTSWIFPNLATLDISNNPLLHTLPFSLIRHTRNSLRKIKHRHTDLHPPDNAQMITIAAQKGRNQRTFKHFPKRVGTTTLVDQIITVLLRYQNTLHPLDRAQWTIDQSLYLPIHLAQKLKYSWICDLCDQPQLYISDRVKNKKDDHFFKLGWQLDPEGHSHSHSSAVMFGGNVCTSCQNLHNLSDATLVE